MAECVVCGSADFDLQDGLYFCSECSTQSQGVHQEVATEEDIFTAGYSRAIRRGKASKEDAEKVVDNTSVLEKFQTVLKLQADALIKMGYDPTVKEAVKLMWFQYLKQYGYAFADSEEKPGAGGRKSVTQRKRGTATRGRGTKRKASGSGKRSNPRAKAAKTTEQSEDSEEGDLFDEFPGDEHLFADDSDMEDSTTEMIQNDADELYFFLRKHLTQRRDPRLFTIKHTVALVYLALLYTEQYVLPVDFVRWIKTNKIPFYNLVSCLPRSWSSDKSKVTVLMPKRLMSADVLSETTKFLHHYIPLPLLPTPSAIAVCHTLMERLKLPGSIYPLVDKAVTVLYRPNLRLSMIWSQRRSFLGNVGRFDSECMAVVMTVLRLLYRLDDQFEMEDIPAGQESSGDLDPASDAVFMWPDWVCLYCQHLQESSRSNVPMLECDFERLRDYQQYLKFCKVEIFVNNRPAPIKLKHRKWNPELYSNLSELFTRHHLSMQRRREGPCSTQQGEREGPCSTQQGEREGPCSTQGESSLTESTLRFQENPPFTPRLVPLEALLQRSRRASENYSLLVRSPRNQYLHNVVLSCSMWFLLQVCSELLDISKEELYFSLISVETVLFHGTVVPVERLANLMK